jgi:WD40 repeat protein
MTKTGIFGLVLQVKKSKMVFHSARVQCLAWSPSSEMLASGSLDMSIIVWPMGEGARVTHARAHTEGVTQLAFTDATTLVSAGADACLRVWTVAA